MSQVDRNARRVDLSKLSPVGTSVVRIIASNAMEGFVYNENDVEGIVERLGLDAEKDRIIDSLEELGVLERGGING